MMTCSSDSNPEQNVAATVALHRDFPAWAIWLPVQEGEWTAIRPASARPPGPGLPMIWVHAATSVELAARMRAADLQVQGC
jgi:hypothetical protein